MALACLALLNLIVFAPVAHHEFVTWDDPLYILDNPHVTGGLTLANASWALTAGYAANWHPLTWWSHMLDVQWYGLSAGPHHLTSLGLHIANTLLLFSVLKTMTRAFGPSLFVAALFAVHPLHVESVAWVAERKDVLSTLFWMLTLWAYVRYVRQPDFVRYALVFLLLAAGLMAKPMLVTLPFVLLLLDFWPLDRVVSRGWWPLVREKIPLLMLALASSVITFEVQRHGGAVTASAVLPLTFRVENALVSYATYIARMLWPARLAVVYPYPGTWPAWEIAGSVVMLCAITAAVMLLSRRRPYLVVGWLWYVGTLVPVIGLVQVGSQPSADRYAYVPLVGLFIILAWGVSDLLAHTPRSRPLLATFAGMVIVACVSMARIQVGYWHDSLSLWDRAVQVTSDNYIAENSLGAVFEERGRVIDATAHYREAVRINPDYPYAQNNLGVQLKQQHRTGEAVDHLTQALRAKPDFAEAHYNLANAFIEQGRTGEALTQYSMALQFKPDYAEAHNNLGTALAKAGQLDDAVQHFSDAIQLRPMWVDPYNNMGMALASQGKLDAATREFSEALRINPSDEFARHSLAELAAITKSSR